VGEEQTTLDFNNQYDRRVTTARRAMCRLSLRELRNCFAITLSQLLWCRMVPLISEHGHEALSRFVAKEMEALSRPRSEQEKG
jgi:hypothetical protein